MLEKAKSPIHAAMKSPAGPSPSTSASAPAQTSAPAACPKGSSTPEHSTISAVSVQMSAVSTNTSKIPSIACSSGPFVLAEAWAMGEDPSPASLENIPRRSPQLSADLAPHPAAPPRAAFFVNAP